MCIFVNQFVSHKSATQIANDLGTKPANLGNWLVRGVSAPGLKKAAEVYPAHRGGFFVCLKTTKTKCVKYTHKMIDIYSHNV